jgi:predicted esterase
MKALALVPTLLWYCSKFRLRPSPGTLVRGTTRREEGKNPNADVTQSAQSPMIRVLGLHGSGGTAQAFRQLLDVWNESLNDVQFTTSTVQGETPMENGFAWWRLGRGERSFTATYDGYDTSATTVLSHVKNDDSELIIAHSQGAILTTALLAQGLLGGTVPHPRVGYILNGVAWPNPYTLELDSLKVTGHPRVLLITGVNDKITPPEQGFRVEAALKQAGCNLTVLLHPGGHSLPMPATSEDNAWEKIEAWIRNGRDDARSSTY